MENKNYDKAFPIFLREAKKELLCTGCLGRNVFLWAVRKWQLAWEWWIKAALQGKRVHKEGYDTVCKRIKRGFGRLYEGRNVVADRCNERELGSAVKNLK